MKYRVMEYLDADCSTPLGYACLERKEFAKWEKSPHQGEVKAFAIVEGMEELAEWGKISCKRLWDAEAATDTLPINVDLDEWYDSLAREVDEYGEIIDEEEAINREGWKNLCEIFGEKEMYEMLKADEEEKETTNEH